ncbi:MAG TPA: ROK family protein [Mesotoga infera]|uniref:ROK family protein n=1 Tax=Mesotoga infera TaxID=1236046 RepID=A0A7C1GUV5_9BACT|nr:ROK family protein [Mesotoga infera]
MPAVDIAIDIGGTKTLVSAFGDSEQEAYESEEFSTKPAEGVDDFFERLSGVCFRMKGRRDVNRWGLCTAGAVSPEKGNLIWSPNLGWKDVELFRRASSFLDTKGVVENDCNAAAFGEWTFRKDIESLIYVTISTGIGMGIVARGKILRGANNSAGEIGHTIVKPDGPTCTCGRRGCLQAISGGRGLENRAHDSLGIEISAKEIIDRAQLNEPLFKEMITEASERLGRFLCNLIDSLDPSVLVIGGSLGKNRYYFDRILKIIEENRYRIPGKKVKVELSSVEPNPNIIGILSLSRRTYKD